MSHTAWKLDRRQALGLLGAGWLSSRPAHSDPVPVRIAGQDAEIRIGTVSRNTVRIRILPLPEKPGARIPDDGSLVREAQMDSPPAGGGLTVHTARHPLRFSIVDREGRPVQKLTVDAGTGAVSFEAGAGPLLGLGEGGAQFDRRGSMDAMISGQGGYKLRTHGGRVPIPWLIGTAGWALFFHHPFGTFDLTGPECRFQPGAGGPLPLDIFATGARDPAAIMREYARLTGYAQMPPLWTFGYQQSHRTLASRDEILEEARTFRAKRLPCDAFIYLGTGFCPSGWNTANGSFSWNRKVFSDPAEILKELHRDHFKVVLHAVILPSSLRGSAGGRCEAARFDEELASCYWDAHRKVFATGVDGWWPDEGDDLDIRSRLTRIRMYWDGAQLDRPGRRPYALHRNGYAGMQRYASFLWSGDVYSTWETLRTHIPIAVNTALSGVPYWGTDTGGFVPTREFTGELYVRWFQFSAFCPLFRSHGRTWKLRLPWGWNTGALGPSEVSGYGEAANPDPGELHNARVEPICRQYLELRYRLMPYLYSAVHECCTTGMPILRALWLHYPEDSTAVARGDEYLWGRDLLVAPVTEKGATSRGLYLPKGVWHDFWTEERVEGGRELTRDVDLATIPLYARAGTILPLGPVKQYTSEQVGAPLSVSIYPGADGSFLLYEDDGVSFRFRQGEWTGLLMFWDDRRKILKLRLQNGSRLFPPGRRTIQVRLAPGKESRTVDFRGSPVEVRL